MKSQEICIVHLSDLHFRSGRYSSVYASLIEDITAQTCSDENLIFVVSGDFATAGKVKESSNEILKFFQNLTNQIPKTKHVLGVELVPGNHDVDRPKIDNKYHELAFAAKDDEFSLLKDGIYALFKEWGVKSKESSGVTTITYNQQRLAFIRIDTSGYLSRSEAERIVKDDFNRHGLSDQWESYTQAAIVDNLINEFTANIKKQVASINTSYSEIASWGEARKPYITFAVSHHPLTMLATEDDDIFADVLFRNNLYFVDMNICGHKHKAHLYYTLDNDRQKVMLMSGVGRQESQDSLVRYSIYRISLERNTCQVKVRSATEGTQFKPEESIRNERCDEFGKIKEFMLPLKSNRIGGVIYLTACSEYQAKGVFADQLTLALIPTVELAIREIQRLVMGFISEYGTRIGFNLLSARCLKNSLPKRFLIWPFRKQGIDKESERLQNIILHLSGRKKAANSNYRLPIAKDVRKKRYFEEFLNDVCKSIAGVLCGIKNEFETEEPEGKSHNKVNIEWRVHYRIYKNIKANILRPKSDVYVSHVAIEPNSKKYIPRPRDISFGGLIEGAFNSKSRMMIDSAVPGVNKASDTTWSDFMTICPRFNGSVVSIRDRKNNRMVYRPFFSFGISLRCEDIESLQHGSRILYLMEYLRLAEVIENAITRFMTMACIEPNDLASYLVK